MKKNNFESMPVRIASFLFMLSIALMLIFAWRITTIRTKIIETQQILQIGYRAQYTLRNLVQLLASEEKEKIDRLLEVRPRRDEIVNVLDKFETLGKKRGLPIIMSNLEIPPNVSAILPAPVVRYRLEIDTNEESLPALLEDIENFPYYIDIMNLNLEESMEEIEKTSQPPRTTIDLHIFTQ